MRETIRHCPLVLLTLLALVVMASGCKSNPTPSPTSIYASDEAVAVIGGTTITREQLVEQLFASHGSQALRSMMLQLAVQEETKLLGIEVTEEEIMQELSFLSQGYGDDEQFYQAMKEQLNMSRAEVREDARYRLYLEKLSFNDVEVSEQEIDEYLTEHGEEFMPLRQFLISQIVVASEADANRLLQQLTEGASFEEIAQEYSLDEFTAEHGGDLGWIEELDPFEEPEVLQAAASMQIGEIQGPVETEQGFVIVQLNGIKDVEGKTQEEIRAEAWRQIAWGKAESMKVLEQNLLDKYNATYIDTSLKP